MIVALVTEMILLKKKATLCAETFAGALTLNCV